MFGFGKQRVINRMEGSHFLAGMIVFEMYRHKKLDLLGPDGAGAHGAAMMSALFGTVPSTELLTLVDYQAAQKQAEADLRSDSDLLELVVQTLRVENTLKMAKKEGLIEPTKLAVLERYGALVPLPPTPSSFQDLTERFLARLPVASRQRVFANFGIGPS